MKYRLLAFLLAFVTTNVFTQPRPTRVIGAGEGAGFKAPYFQPEGTTRTLSSDTVYILTGIYYVDSLAVLNIHEGTVILGDSATAGTLCIKRGGRIYANGTAQNPIVFSSRNAPGQRNSGDWGGVIILGRARNNQGLNTVIEGGLHPSAVYGGVDDDDSSGVLRYVRIEFGGIPFLTDNEINGLTMGSVGRRTVLEAIQVSFANDDAFEWFGGTVNGSKLVSWRNLDDDFDSDFGWSGRVQFGFSKRDPNIFDFSASSNSNGFESDNQGGSSGPWPARPTTSGIFSNVTALGPLADTAGYNSISNKHDYAAFLRRRTAVSIYNSVLAGYRHGIVIRNDSTQHFASLDSLQIRNTSIQAGRRMIGNDTPPTTFSTGGGFGGFSGEVWFNNPAWGNAGSTPRRPGDVGFGPSAFTLGTSVDPRPALGSEASIAGTDFSNPRLAGLVATSYRGAFDPALPMNQQWTAGWTNFDPQFTDYITTDVAEHGHTVPAEYSIEQNYPNPFNPSTTIEFMVPRSGLVSLKVYNMIGQEVATLVNEQLKAASYQVVFNADNLSTGTYIYRMVVDGFVASRKMMLIR